MPSQATPLPQPKRGEIWFVKFPSDPPEKNPRPVVIVSMDARNQHPRAETVLAVPLSTTLRESPTHIRLQPGETGLAEACDLQDRKSTRLNSSHSQISYAVFCLKKKNKSPASNRTVSANLLAHSTYTSLALLRFAYVHNLH